MLQYHRFIFKIEHDLVECGKFFTINKVEDPIEIIVTAMPKDYEEQGYDAVLNEFIKEAKKAHEK